MGNVLSLLSIATLFGVGAGAAIAPETLAASYGLAIGDPDADRGYVRALGARDATVGAIALAFALRGQTDALRTTLGFTAFFAAMDFLIVARERGVAGWSHLLIHGTGVAGLLLAAATLGDD